MTIEKNLRSNKLTPRQQIFAQEFVIDFNGTRAAIRAGYATSSAHVTGAQLIKLPKVHNFIKNLQAESVKRNEISADMVIREFAKIAFANYANYLTAGNEMVDVSKLTADQTSAIESINITTTKTDKGRLITTSVKMKLHDKVAALEKLGKHLGIFETHNLQKAGQVIIVSVKKME